MAIRAVVFDLGGVLENEVDTDKDAQWSARLNMQPGEYRERLYSSGLLMDATLGKFSEVEMWQKYQEVYGLAQEQMEEFQRDLWDEYCGELNVELLNYFKRLRPRYKTAILSNGIPGARREECARFHFDELADLLIYSSEEKAAKPDRRIYEILCERLDVLPQEVVFLDDHPKIIATASEFGIHAVLCENTEQAIADVEAILAKHA